MTKLLNFEPYFRRYKIKQQTMTLLSVGTTLAESSDLITLMSCGESFKAPYPK